MGPAPPFFLSWKGLRWWSVGRRAPALCKFFVRARRSSKLAMVGRLLMKRRKKKEPPPPPPPPPAPHAEAQGASSSSSSSLQAPRTASPLSYQRFSVDGHPSSSSNCDSRNAAVLPRALTLGREPSSVSALLRQDSGGPRLSALIKETCARGLLPDVVGNAPAALALGDLFAGNQFLARVNAAPVLPAAEEARALRPSSVGLLSPHAALRCRQSELKDRIVFFV